MEIDTNTDAEKYILLNQVICCLMYKIGITEIAITNEELREAIKCPKSFSYKYDEELDAMQVRMFDMDMDPSKAN